jgi:hypothetical protein
VFLQKLTLRKEPGWPTWTECATLRNKCHRDARHAQHRCVVPKTNLIGSEGWISSGGHCHATWSKATATDAIHLAG